VASRKPDGYYTKGRGVNREVHPMFEPKGQRIPKSRFVHPSREQVSDIHTKKRLREIRETRGKRQVIVLSDEEWGIAKPKTKISHVRKATRDAPKAKPKPKKRAYGRYDSQRVFYEQCQKIAKKHPKWSAAKVEAEATIRLSGIGEPSRTKEKRLLAKIEKISSAKGVTYAKDLELEVDVHGHVVGGKDFETLSSLLRKGDVYSPRERMYKPTQAKVKPKEKEIKPKPKPKPKKVKKHRIKPPKPRMKMTHLEKMHLLASAKQFNIDPQEVDDTLTYSENKKHIQEMAEMKGYSEAEIRGSEEESKEWSSQYQLYLNNLKGELENAGYTVTEPKM